MRSPVYLAAAVAAGLVLGVSAVSAGCSSAEDAAAADGDAGDAGEAGLTYPAFKPPVPQVINYFEGVTLKEFTVVPVLFAGDTSAAVVQDFLTKYAASPEWAAGVAEYGGGKMKVGKAVILNEAAPSAITAAEIDDFLRGKLDGTHPEWGSADSTALAKTVYAVIYPVGTQVMAGQFGTSCTDFIAYHSSTSAAVDAPDGGDGGEGGGGGQPSNGVIIYSISAPCSSGGDGLTQEQTLTAFLSHELLEIASDPYPAQFAKGGAAYGFLDADHSVWGTLMHGAEIADLCNLGGTAFVPPSVGYTAVRSWSNAAAKAYHDPCVPSPPGQPYFNAFMETPETFSLNGNPQELDTRGVKISRGETKTFDIMLFSDRPTNGPWDVVVSETPLPSQPGARALDISREVLHGVNGDKLQISVYAKGTTPTGTTAITIASFTPTQVNVWHTAVVITAEEH